MSFQKLSMIVVLACSLPSGSTCTAQPDYHVFPNEPARIFRLPRIVAVEAFRKTSNAMWNSYPMNVIAKRGAEQQETPDELNQRAHRMIEELAALSRERSLTRDDLLPIWGVIQKLHSSNADTYDRMLQRYRQLNRLPLPPFDKLETIRLLGQDQYLRGNYANARKLYNSALEVKYDHLTEEYREVCADTLGNILYFNGLVLTKQDKPEATIENFRRIIDDPELFDLLSDSTAVNILARLGRIYYERKQYSEAESSFVAGIGVLDGETEAEKQYRIEMEVGKIKSHTMAENPEQPDYDELESSLTAIKEKFSGKGYPDFDDILKALVVVAREHEDKSKYVDALQELRSYYKKKHELVGEWEDTDELFFFDSSSVLIKHYLDGKEYDDAKTILVESVEFSDPPAHWLHRFPKTFVDRALGKSVLNDKEK